MHVSNVKHRHTIPNLRNACLVLKRLGEAAEGLSLAEVCTQLLIPRATAFRILNTLCLEGLVEKQAATYRLGGQVLRLGLVALDRVRIRERALPLLRQLAQSTGETAHLAILSANRALIVEVCDSPLPIRATSRPGFLAELHCSATGKIFLAAMPDEQVRDVLKETGLNRRTDNTLCIPAAVLKDLEIIRRRGYATDNEEFHPGVRCLASPVHDARGQVVAALGITGSSTRFTKARFASAAKQVIATAETLSQSLGFYKENDTHESFTR